MFSRQIALRLCYLTALSYFVWTLTGSSKLRSVSDITQLAAADYFTEIHLITQWYWDANVMRRHELLHALEINIENQHITRIHLITNIEHVETERKQLEATLKVGSSKLVWVTTNNQGRLLASDAFTYASNFLKGQIALLANLDISFDESLKLLLSKQSDLSRYKAFFLSRYERPPNEHLSIGTQCGPKFMGSADTLAFIPPLPKTLIQHTHLHLGSWGIESRLMWEFEQAGIEGRNPCYDIKSWHNHASGVKNTRMPVVNIVDKQSSIAFPDFLISNRTHLDHPHTYKWAQKMHRENNRNV